jgi:hypothetical protein
MALSRASRTTTIGVRGSTNDLDDDIMRKRFLTQSVTHFALLLLLAACSSGARPSPTAAPAPTLPAVGELVEAAAPGPVTTVGYLYTTAEGSVLADSLSAGANGAPAPAEGLSVWIESAPTLPADSSALVEGGASYALVEARGALEGPGQFGPGGRYAFQMVAPVLKPLSVRELTIQLLLENSGLYEGQAVHIQGQLIADAEAAILVERLGRGGVPEADALQLKLAAPPRDPAVAAGLSPAGSGKVRYGPVDITGLWRADRLYPLLVVPQPLP